MTPSQLEQILAERGPPPRSAIAQGLRLVLFEGRNITQAAKEVGVTRPALSKSLKRLKKYAEGKES